jgi:ferrochelatase
MSQRIAVVLFNLGGPDSLAAVRPFLFNLFNDPAIIGLPALPRWLLAQLISRRRETKAQGIYAQMGNRSPILPNTEAQANALTAALQGSAPETEFRTFIAMRYWHPLTEETVAAVKSFQPTRVILLPLYPQFSTTTTASSYARWMRIGRAQGLAAPHRLVCCYPVESGFVRAAVAILRAAVAEAAALAPQAKPLVILSAHGLPKKVVDAGDPYVAQVEASAAAIAAALDLPREHWIVSYQSRVGPLEWVGPSTDAVIEQAARDKRAIALFPIAFVSEHSETLVELDIEYRHLAEGHGAPAYVRAPTVSTHPDFIAGLARLVQAALSNDEAVQPGCGRGYCAEAARCACKAGAA